MPTDGSRRSEADVLIVGNAGLDTMVYLDSDRIDLDRDSTFSRTVDRVGHTGAFCARGFAGLDRRTRFLGALGHDHPGMAVRESLGKHGVELLEFLDPDGTARSVNLMTPDGRRRAFYDGRGHMGLTAPRELVSEGLARVRLAHFAIPNWARFLLPTARKAGVVVSVDLQDIDDPADEYRRDFIEHADIVFLSAAHLADPPSAAVEVMRQGPARVVVVGLGADGALTAVRPVAAPDDLAGVQISHHRPLDLDLPIVDTNGAGDGLSVGFLDAFVFEGAGVAESVRRGQILARWFCSQEGGEMLLSRDQLDALDG